MIYELDEVLRPSDKVINDDEELDRWYKGYRADVVKKLKEHHKSAKTSNINYDPPKPRRGFVFGGDKK